MTQNRVEDFFIPENEVKLSEELDYGPVEEYISTADAFSRSTYQSIYIIDYFRKKFVYVSRNSLILCGLSPEKMLELSYRFYLEYVPENEQKMLLEFNRAGFEFFNNIPAGDKREWYIQYDFHVLKDKRPVLIHHKLTPLALTSDGRIWLALCVVSPSNHTEAGHIEIHHVGSDEYYEYNRVTRRWMKSSVPMLTDGEKTVITLSIQGLTMTEIADKMCLSPETIKKYRKQIFEKLDVSNISEAIVAATNNKML
ncbi:MAG: helix-turn-helix transcriptional regulator [Muribaculaceae bacterium]|nr:helix-turn-helix transcriptional regulator [Muribaculaceae bacterium]